MARQRSAKPCTAVRIRSRPQFVKRLTINDLGIMAVTRLKRKDRRNKAVSRMDKQRLKLATNIELGSRSAQSTKDQLAKNSAIIAQLEASAK